MDKRARTRLFSATGIVLLSSTLVACGAQGGDNNGGSDLVVTVRYVDVEGRDVVCAQIDSSRGVALSCAWPDSIRERAASQ